MKKSEPEDKVPLRFVSLNLQRRSGEPPADLRARMAEIARVLLHARPDIIAVQEALPDAWRALHDALEPSDDVFCPRVDGKEVGEGVGLFLMGPPETSTPEKTSFWFSDTPDTPSKAWKATHPRVCAGLRIVRKGRPVWCLSLHLDHRSALARRRSLEQLGKWIDDHTADNDSLIIGGDFNMPSTHTDFRALLDARPRLRHAAEHHPVGGAFPTFRGWGPFQWGKARIDHCLHSDDWTCTHYRVRTPRHHGAPLSDHRSVIVDLSPASRRVGLHKPGITYI